MRRPTRESVIHGCVLAGVVLCMAGRSAFAQGAWEFIGPDFGYRPDAFFVSPHALYLALSNQDETGLGLFRYRFDQRTWEPFAWAGYRVLGISVWGASDENILLIRYDPDGQSRVFRSSDSGESWVQTTAWSFKHEGMSQASSDRSRIIIRDPTYCSSDGGWTWTRVFLGIGGKVYDLCFDPSNAQVAYLTGDTSVEVDVIHKSIDGGAKWDWSYVDGYAKWGIAVERGETSHVMCATTGHMVDVTADSGNTWSVRQAPLMTKMLHSPPWSPTSFFVAGSDPNETRFDVWRTEDLGETWFHCGDGLPNLPGTALWLTSMYLESNPVQPVLYAALEGSGVWRWQYTGAGTPDAEEGLPEARLLAYPVPSSDQFTCGVRLSRPEHVRLRLFDAHGRLVRTVRDGVFQAGTHIFSGRDAETGELRTASGIYYLRLDAAGSHEERKIVILK